MPRKGDNIRVQVRFLGGPRDGETVEMEVGSMAKKTSGPRYVLDPDRPNDYPLRYIWRQQ